MKLFLPTFFLLLLTMTFPALSLAQESLDPDFGNNGQLITDFSTYNDDEAYAINDEAYAIAVQDDGKILVAGQSQSKNGADTDIALARYLADGSLDNDFGKAGDGKVTVAVGPGDDSGLALAIQKDGMILVSGTTTNETDMDLTVIRLTAKGSPDTDFGQDGRVSILLTGTDDSAQAVLVQEDGKIILAGNSEADDTTHLFVVRLEKDGTIDTTFDDSGIFTDTGSDNSAAYSAVLINDNGHIILGGSRDIGGQTRAALFSFQNDGKVDQEFGADGSGVLDSNYVDSVFYDLALLENGKIVAAGAIKKGSYQSILFSRFTTGGILDQSFNNQGTVQVDLGKESVAYGLAIAEDDSIYLSGSSSSDQDMDFILLHYTASGTPVLDTTEAIVQATTTKLSSSDTVASAVELTYILTDFEQSDDIARAISIQENGNIILAGSVGNGEDTDFGLLSFSTANSSQQPITNGINTTEGYYIATTPPTRVTRNSAASGGFLELTGTNSLSISARGVCYGISPAPGIKDFPAPETTQTTTENADGTITTNETTIKTDPLKTILVREGCTSDGSGLREFRSDILDITPDTTYYVRAYAQLESSSGTIVNIYGNELQFTTKDACFIATAAYGSLDDSHVLILRQFRDTYLKSSVLGRNLINRYYLLSPPLAQLISEHPAARGTVRLAMAPVATISYLTLHPVFAAQFLGMSFLILGLFQFVCNAMKQTPVKE